MAKTRRQWVYSPAHASRVPESVKREVTAKANRIIETQFKPEHLELPPEKPRFNYIVDIYSRWRGAFFYFCAKYACPGPNAISPYFEVKFTRLAYQANGRFNVAYMRHTDKWFEVYADLTLDEALATIREEELFHP